MVSKGIIKKISNSDIFIEPFSSDLAEDEASCASGNCESCSKHSKKRLVKVLNSENFTLQSGNIVEFEVSSVHIFKATLRVLIIPLAAFALLYYISSRSFGSGEQMRILIGLAGFASALSLNFLFRKKSSETEIPRIVRVI